jgi:protein SCO1/2
VVSRSLTRRAFLLAVLLSPAQHGWPQAGKESDRLPIIGPAPAFALTAARGERLSLSDLRGNVLAVTFIYTACIDTCGPLTAKLAEVARRLGSDFGQSVRFVSITVDPERDTPTRLREYSEVHGANAESWSFLTGAPAEIKEVLRRYGVYAKRTEGGTVDHLFLTSLIDRTGRLRVQYLGVRFDPGEMHRDLQKLVRE